MKGQTLLDELLRLSELRAIKIRREPMSRGVGAGGFAKVRGEPTVFIDARGSVDAQIEILLAVLRRMDWSDTFLTPSLRKLLNPSAADESNESESASAPSPS